MSELITLQNSLKKRNFTLVLKGKLNYTRIKDERKWS
jgi:hypothetical protein